MGHLATKANEATLVAGLASSLDVRSIASTESAIYLLVMTEGAELGIARIAVP